MIQQDTEVHAPRTSLLPVLGLLFGIAVSVGGTLGVGILRQPGPVASYLRLPWLIMLMWLGGAVYSFLGAVNVAELTTMLPRAGGFYVFAREAMGGTVGFVVGWSDFLTNVAATSYAAMAAVEFLGRIIPWIGRFDATAAVLLLLAFATLQWFGVRLSGVIQQAAAAVAAVALLGLIVACFAIHAPHPTGPAPPTHAASFLAAMVLAIQSIVVTYDGWYGPIYFAEEARHPARELPRAMFTGLALVAAIYLLMNFALLRVLGPAGLAASRFAAADAAKLMFGRASEVLIAAVAVATMLTLLHGLLMCATRILFAVSRDGLFWQRAGEVAANGSPRAALALTTLVAVALILSGTLDRLIALAGFFAVANYCWAYLSLIVLRRRKPDTGRPFRVPAYPMLTVLVLCASLAFLTTAVLSDRENSFYALLLLTASLPICLALRAVRSKRAA